MEKNKNINDMKNIIDIKQKYLKDKENNLHTILIWKEGIKKI